MLGVLGDEWTLLIVQQALLGATRYGEFAARLPISHAVLTRRLTAMTADGLLSAACYQDRPAAVRVPAHAARPLAVAGADVDLGVGAPLGARPRRAPARHAPPRCAAPTSRRWSRAGRAASVVTEKDLTSRWGPSGSWPRSMPVESTRRRSASETRPRGPGLFPETMSILGNRWAFALLVAAFVGTTRFNDFADQLGAPPGSLADRLQIFTAGGVLDASSGGRYRLTEKGRAVFPVLITALQWAQRWFVAPEGPAVLLPTPLCGTPSSRR